jgi:SAM-dependent methyltransferase
LTAERFLHAVFGNNVVIGPHVLRQLDCLGGLLPPHFRECRMDDLGCGDGKLTVLLREIFEPVKLRGFDINPALVRRARAKGIEAQILNLDDHVPTGELAVLWGVLHHLSDPARCLRRLHANYERVFVREPVRGASPACFELGTPLPRSELVDLLRGSLPGAHVFSYHDCVFAFCDMQDQADLEPAACSSSRLATWDARAE